MAFREDRSAVSHVVSFMVALTLFSAAIAGVVLALRQGASDSASPDAARTDVEAQSLADVLLGSVGVGWSAGPDGVQRLGLANANGSGLEPSSLEALRGAMAESLPNGKLDYPDAQRSLGIDPAGSKDFHLRMYPVAMETVYDTSLAGLSTAYIGDWTSLGTVTVPLGTPTDQLAVQANVQINQTMHAQTVHERQAIDGLGVDFEDRVLMTAGSPTILVDLPFPLPDSPLLSVLGVPLLEGDVYPDHKGYLDAVLAGRLQHYDLLIVGSGVDHSTLTSNVVKDAVRDWVLAGGTLVVLGSAEQAYQWLQPLFHSGVSTVNGATSAPDVSHPLLREPHQLAWTNYDTHGRGWDIKDKGSEAHYDDFSHVVVQGGEDVFAVSKDGAFGTGRIVLTTFMPREIASTIGAPEAAAFFENIALYTDRAQLYLDYGPQMPSDVAVSVAVRDSWLWDARLGQVPVRLEIHVWG